MITSGISPKGKIFIRDFSKSGKLQRKRVADINKGIQYDTCFDSKGNPLLQLITNGNKQEFRVMDSSIGFFKKLKIKLFGLGEHESIIEKNGKKMIRTAPFDCAELAKTKSGQFAIGFNQVTTGYEMPAINKEFAKLKQQLLNQMYH